MESRSLKTRKLTLAHAGIDSGASLVADQAFDHEVRRGERFEFGKNWRNFLSVLSDERIEAAVLSLRDLLEVDTLEGKRFLDIGSGSGLFSLAARKLGATVYSLDYDPNSVECTRELKRRYFRGDQSWTIERGSVLDRAYIESLGHFDVVYSWGVLHHTGSMWEALHNAALPVTRNGQLCVAIYNDLGGVTRRWAMIKRLYCSGFAGKALVSSITVPYFTIRDGVMDILRRRSPLARYREYKNKARGMSVWYDIFDWLGGYPYEVAKPEEIMKFYRERGFTLTNMTTCGAAHGCNEFTLVKKS